MKLDVQVHSALARARQRIFDAHSGDIAFTGCGIGLRRRGGVLTDEPVVVAMVVKKLPAGAISRSRLLPQTVQVDGHHWGVDVVEAGPLTLASQPGIPDAPPQVHGPITGLFRPLVMGCGVSDLNGPQPGTGTLGCMVRDTSDNTVCVLGSNTVLAQNGNVPAGAPVIQPGLADFGLPSDEVATMKRFVPFTASGTNQADVAIARLKRGVSYSQGVADSLMKPISPTHPAVGMCLAQDQFGLNCFLAPITTALSAIGAKLLPATSGSPCTVAPQVGMHLEKVARTSGYTSSTVVATAVQIKVGVPVLVFVDTIWTQGFQLPGDTGAVACEGGNGRTFVPPPQSPCPVLGSVGHFFNIPLANDNVLSTKLKNQFLAKSLVGALMIGLVYDNSATIINRVKGKQAPGPEQAFALTFYDKYHRIVKAALADPTSTTRVVTKGNLDDFEFILGGLSGAGGEPPVLTAAESNALQVIFNEVLVHTKGMDYKQLMAYMNQEPVFQKVVAALAKVRTISLTGKLQVKPAR